MFILHVTTKACLPGWVEALLGLLLAFLLGWLLRKFMSSGSDRTGELEGEISRLKAQLKDCESKPVMAAGLDADAEASLRGEISALVTELQGSKDANGLLRARLEDLENEVPMAAAPGLDEETENALKEEVSGLILDLKGAKEANNLLRARLSDIENDPSLAISPLSAGDVDPDDLTKIEGIGPKIAELCNGIGVYTFKQLSMTSVGQLQDMLDDAGSRYKVHSPNTWPAQSSLAAQGLWDQLKAWQDILDGGKI